MVSSRSREFEFWFLLVFVTAIFCGGCEFFRCGAKVWVLLRFRVEGLELES